MTQLPERLRLDLADPLPGHLEVLAHLLEGVIGFLADPEPHPENPLLAMENVVLLPHLGSATTETRVAMGMRAVENLRLFFAGQPLRDRVV